MLTIGKVANTTQMPIKTVRYYDEIGLVKPSGHTEKGYRLYTERDMRLLTFIRHARSFGFSIETCRELLGLYGDPNRPSCEVKQIALMRLEEIEQKMKELQLLHKELSQLAELCHGDQRPECPIIDFLAEP